MHLLLLELHLYNTGYETHSILIILCQEMKINAYLSSFFDIPTIQTKLDCWSSYLTFITFVF